MQELLTIIHRPTHPRSRISRCMFTNKTSQRENIEVTYDQDQPVHLHFPRIRILLTKRRCHQIVPSSKESIFCNPQLCRDLKPLYPFSFTCGRSLKGPFQSLRYFKLWRCIGRVVVVVRRVRWRRCRSPGLGQGDSSWSIISISMRSCEFESTSILDSTANLGGSMRLHLVKSGGE